MAPSTPEALERIDRLYYRGEKRAAAAPEPERQAGEPAHHLNWSQLCGTKYYKQLLEETRD
jgi:hypothetical protein